MNTFNYPVFGLTFCLISGILLERWLVLNPRTGAILCGISLLLALANHLMPRTAKIWSSFLFYIHFICIGLLVSSFHNPLSHKNHFISYQNQEIKAVIKLLNTLRPTSFAWRYEGEVIRINEKESSGNVLIQIDRDSTKSDLNEIKLPHTDDFIALKTKILKPNASRNPYAFDYSQYLQDQGIYGQIYTSTEEIYNLGSRQTSLLGFAAKLRLFFQERLAAFDVASREWGVINALVLGQRDELSTDLRDQYANAGVIHILAVSGLHVGIVLYLLQLLLKPLGNSRKPRLLRAFLCILGVWCFATLTGLSPSVLRAATMFSFLQIGQSSLRKNGGMNGLVTSAFFLLLIDPSLIYQVGFQLSYAAVFFILWLQPSFFKLWNPSNRVLKYFWGIASVSITAQLGVLPLSLYYFHQFSLMFLLSNLVILPALFIILSLGFLVLLLASFNTLPSVVAEFYERIIYYMNEFISWSAGFESLILKDIYFNAALLAFSYIIIITTGRFLNKPDYKYLYGSLSCCLLMILYLNYEKWSTTDQKLYILHAYRKSLLFKHQAKSLQVYYEDSTQVNRSVVKDFTTHQLINNVQLQPIQNYLKNKESEILVVDQSALFQIADIKPDYVLLRKSPKINLERLIETFPKTHIIADGSNYRSAVQRWERTCKDLDIPFHNTYKDGYFVIE